MNRGQRKLLKALSQIEDADISTESSPNATIEQEKPRKKKTKKPLKATDPIQKMVGSMLMSALAKYHFSQEKIQPKGSCSDFLAYYLLEI